MLRRVFKQKLNISVRLPNSLSLRLDSKTRMSRTKISGPKDRRSKKPSSLRPRSLCRQPKPSEMILMEVTEKQLQEASGFAELHSQHVDLIKEKQALEVEVTTQKAEVAEAGARQQTALASAELLQRELQERVEASKMEALELQAKLDAVTMNNLNEDGKGNSLFSEVNDRRERVENQLKVYEKKYEVLKNNYNVKMAELQKTKVHNTKLLSIAVSSSRLEDLEELLASERTKHM